MSLGAGVFRLFEFHLALLQSARGVLLLDGVEQGLHSDAYPLLWQMLLSRARALNVQLFAVTHSPDYARALAAASAREDEEATRVRLSRLRGVLQAKVECMVALETVAEQMAEAPRSLNCSLVCVSGLIHECIWCC